MLLILDLKRTGERFSHRINPFAQVLKAQMFAGMISKLYFVLRTFYVSIDHVVVRVN